MALEDLADVLTRKKHDTLGRVKDIMAGAVLIASMGTAVVGILILGNPLIQLI